MKNQLLLNSSIQMIAVDLDGTLFTNDQKITARTKKAVREATEAGIVVAACTGRMICELGELHEWLPEIRYSVCFGGGALFDLQTKEFIFLRQIPYETLVSIYQYFSQYDVMFEMATATGVFTEARCLNNLSHYCQTEFQRIIRGTRTPIPISMAEFIRKWQKPIERIIIFFADMDEHARALKEARRFEVSAVAGLVNDIEICESGWDKGRGLDILCQKLRISPAHVMGIGDSMNDLPMLKFVGFPVAMANACDEIKAAAKFCADSNDRDGVAKVIEQVLQHKSLGMDQNNDEFFQTEKNACTL